MFKKYVTTAIVAAGTMLLANSALASTSVSWLSPPDGAHFAAGSTQTVTGQASGVGQTGGTGLDLVLVMDSSGSMGWYGGQAAQNAAAKALVAALPQATTSVAIVDFDSSVRTWIGLTQLDSTNTAVNTAIDKVDASGGTDIAAGIGAASPILTGSSNQTRLQAMVVMSDGGSPWDAAGVGGAADTAVTAGVEAIHSVGMGNSVDAASLQAAVDGVDNIYNNADDYGKYVGSSFSNLVGIFSGTSGNLVGLDYIDITTPDSVVHSGYATDGLGNFNIDYTLAVGANLFSVTAFGDDGTQATATWTLYGDSNGNTPTPEPGTMLLLGTGLTGLVVARRKKAAKKA